MAKKKEKVEKSTEKNKELIENQEQTEEFIEEEPEKSKNSELDPETLKWIQTYDFNLIPKKLFDQINYDHFRVDLLCEYSNNVFGPDNLFNMLYVFVDEEGIIQGFIWCYANIFMNAIIVNMLSVDKKYQGSHKLVPIVIKKLDEVAKRLNKVGGEFNCIYADTKIPEIFEEHNVKETGFTQIKYKF